MASTNASRTKAATFDLAKEGTDTIGVIMPIPWIFHLAKLLPFARTRYEGFVGLASELLLRKLQVNRPV